MTGAKLTLFPAAYSGRVLRNPARRGRTDVVAKGGRLSSVSRSSDALGLFDRAPGTELALVSQARGHRGIPGRAIRIAEDHISIVIGCAARGSDVE